MLESRPPLRPRARARARRRAAIAACSAAALAIAVPSAGASPGAAGVEGVFSPLGFAVAPDGSFYVAEAFAGILTRVAPDGTRSTLASTGDGGFIGGVALEAAGRVVHYTSSLPPEFQDGPPPDTTLSSIALRGPGTRSVSILEFEAATNPDQVNTYGVVDEGECQDAAAALADVIGPPSYQGVVESNPYAVAMDRGGATIVADAAGNSVLRVSRSGAVSTVGVLPPIPQVLSAENIAGLLAEVNAALADAGLDPLPEDALDACIGTNYQSNPVPTDVEIGLDGDYYVSALPGFPESAGAGSVYRIPRASGDVEKVAGGFTGAVDLAVAEDGSIYVAELFGFQVSRIDPGDDEASASTFVECPTAIEVDARGQVWVAEGGICTDGPPAPGRIVPLQI
jgi:sugar lactone lactonase YvrE